MDIATSLMLTKKAKLLTSLAEAMRDKNSTLSRFYRTKMLEVKQEVIGPMPLNSSVCSFCGECFLSNPGKAKMRFIPKLALQHIDFRVKKRGVPLSKGRQNWVSQYKNSTIRMVIKCSVCNKRQIIKGPARKTLVRKTAPSSVQNPQVSTAVVTKKKRQKKKKKQKQRNAEPTLLETSGRSTASVSMETTSGLDSSYLPVGSPVVTSTPKPVDATQSGRQTSENTTVISRKQTPTTQSRKSHWDDSLTDRKLTNKKLSSSALLDDSLTVTQQKVKKKKKTKDMHAQLQKIFQKDKASNRSSGSLKDFLSSVS